MASSWAANERLRPCMIETMNMTVTTPTITPRMVSPERSLFTQTVSSAITADSLIWPRPIILFASHCLHGVQLRSPPGGI